MRIAALVVGGAYLFRRFTEGSAEEEKVSTSLPPLGQFLVAWSVIFFFLSLGAGPAPALSAYMAVLVMIATLLANGGAVAKDLQAGLKAPAKERALLLRKQHSGHATGPIGKGSHGLGGIQNIPGADGPIGSGASTTSPSIETESV